ncbi:MAG: hypothetical protein EHM49_00135 [Deltaproteobacteria bacterium]|nr:MAG: hypothetical protein EHM49_00135 [Deltaproteobacteria bacterium]
MGHNLNNLSVLLVKPQTIKPGRVYKAKKNGKWQIATGNMMLLASSSKELLPKQRVTVGKSSEGWVVLDSSMFSNPSVVRVRISG